MSVGYCSHRNARVKGRGWEDLSYLVISSSMLQSVPFLSHRYYEGQRMHARTTSSILRRSNSVLTSLDRPLRNPQRRMIVAVMHLTKQGVSCISNPSVSEHHEMVHSASCRDIRSYIYSYLQIHINCLRPMAPTARCLTCLIKMIENRGTRTRIIHRSLDLMVHRSGARHV